MTKKKNTGSRLFLIEFLIVLFFFFIISSVCLRIFGQAGSLTQRSNALYGAQNAAASVVESFKGNYSFDSFRDCVDAAVIDSTSADAATTADHMLQLFYNKEFLLCEKNDCVYTLSAVFVPDSETLSIEITDRNNTVIYELSAVIHRKATKKEVLS